MTNAEREEQGDRRLRASPESQAMQSPDAQVVRNAGASDVKAAQALNRNAHSGSAGGDQNQSIEIVAAKPGGGQELIASRQKQQPVTTQELEAKAAKGDIWARRFQGQLKEAQDLPAEQREKETAEVMKAAQLVFRPEGKPTKPETAESLMDTGTMLAAEAKTNPAAEPVKLLKEWVEKQPDSPQKQAFRQEVRQQAADLSPEMRARMEHLEAVRRKIDAAGLDEGGTHQAIRPEQVTLKGHVEYPENPWQAFNKLRPDQQRDIIKAFETGGAVGQSAYEQQIEAVSESIPKGYYNVGRGLLDTGVSAATFVLELVKQPDKVPQAAGQLAEHLSEAIANGVELSKFAAGQAHDMAEKGDYSPAIRAIGFVVETANERWQAMPLEKRTEKGSELIAEMGIGSLIGAGHNLAKSGKLVDALEEIAQHLKDLTAPGRDKAKRAIGKLLGEVLQPKGLTTQGVEMPIPRDIDDLAMLRNKGLPDNVQPSEKVTTSRRRDFEAKAVHVLEVPENVYEAAEKRGISRELVKEKLDKVAKSLTDAYNVLGDYSPARHGSERAYGSQLHELLRKRIGSDNLIHTEASYKKGLPVPWGKLGSSRVDIALGEHEKPFVSLCLKTLGAVPSAQQERGWYKNLPRMDDDQIIPRIYFKLAK